MRIESVLNVMLNVNEKFNDGKTKKYSPNYYEVLHSSLMELVRNLTERQYNNISLPTRRTFEKLEKEIFALCSNEYREELINYNKENGLFLKENKQNKCSQRKIGFVDLNEGTSI